MHPPFSLAGEMAGLGTALLWSMSALAWAVAGRRIGSVAVNCLRILLAAVILSVLHRVLHGAFWPAALGRRALWLLAASGVIGAGAGDLLLFRSFVLVGPRLGMLVLALAPVLTGLMAYLLPPHERLTPLAIAGIVLTVGGVAWVVAERQGAGSWTAEETHRRTGLGLALGGTVCIAGGYLLSKLGIQAAPEGCSGIAVALVRVVAATGFLWLVLPATGRVAATLRALRDRRAMLIIAAGTIVGPVLGIWLSMLAIAWAHTGVAATLISTAPVIMVPIAWAAYGDRPTPRSASGTVLAVVGVGLLVLS